MRKNRRNFHHASSAGNFHLLPFDTPHNEKALFKLLHLRITELYKKWNGRPLNNWALVRNQLDKDEKIQERIRKYENGGFYKLQIHIVKKEGIPPVIS